MERVEILTMKMVVGVVVVSGVVMSKKVITLRHLVQVVEVV